ncbi:MAG TPA: glutamine--tRNA ligase/YqeY domain fusion protein [Clostridia bacterium]|nr:glutamine--tRNA ligase/YqeY domain fusion protein [Clostridia bacterium]
MDELTRPKNFIEEFIEEDMERDPRIKTRFPPEPNGYLHIGHAKALCIDFGMAEQYGGSCNLRFDDTNPTKEDTEYVEAIKQDIRWLGFEWDKLLFGSSYFDQCFDLAIKLIKDGAAYVDDLSKDEMREYRGTLTEPGRNSPYRERSASENLSLFYRMRSGEFPDGSRTLRAKIDMASPNINMRDPALYRILHIRHHQTGDKWCIYPMYDFAHPIQDAIEGVTHSLCSLEYEAHRPLYNWVVEKCGFEKKPRQIEFARLNMTNTVMSKRYLRRLVEEGLVSGWDDPRMPTLCGMRRRGYTASAIRDFLTRIGVAKADSVVDAAILEHCVREELNLNAHRLMAVIEPLRLVIENWRDEFGFDVELLNLPSEPEAGTRSLPFEKELYIERSDFMAEPVKKYFRLKPDGEVRLKGAYIVKCTRWDVDESGRVTCVYCTVDPDSKSGDDSRKVKGTLHWLPVSKAVPATFRHYEPLFDDSKDAELDFTERLNPNSLCELSGYVEPYADNAEVGERFQFIRMGYYCKDRDSEAERPVYNRVVGLRDSFKID